MKKILLLIPILGICSSLLAQAPQVLNVNANQVDGTKDVLIEFEITNKIDYSGELNVEVWYRTSPDQTQWNRAMSLWEGAGAYGLPNNIDWDAEAQQEVIYSHRIPAGGDTPAVRNIYWKAGEDAHDVKTDQAQVRVIVFYTKEGPVGAAPKDQVSGWDGFDGSTGGDTGGDTGASGDGSVNDGIPVYDLSDEQASNLRGAVTASGYFTIETFMNEYGDFIGQLYPAYESPASSGNWEKDVVGGSSLNAAFKSIADVDEYIAQQGLNPIAHIAIESSF